MSIICKLRGHDLGDWQYQSGSERCNASRSCRRCDFVERTTPQHVWSEWSHTESDRCKQSRTCEKCANQEERTVHVWGPPEYVEERACTQQRACLSCSATERMGEQHDWGEWTYQPGEPCKASRICSRCESADVTETHSFKFQYAFRGVDPSTHRLAHQLFYVCSRCNAKKTNWEPHDWEVKEVKRRADGSVIDERVYCAVCGAWDWGKEVAGS